MARPRRRAPGPTPFRCPKTASRRGGGARIIRAMTARSRRLLPRARRARSPLRRPLLRRRLVDAHLLPARLHGAHAAPRELPLLPERRGGRGRRLSPVPALPAGARARAMRASTRRRGSREGAVNLIENGVLDDGGIEHLAARVGVTSRHLRRIFETEFGVSPIEYAQTQRLLLAKRLLTDTALPVTEVALASGFASVRRFNALFRRAIGWRPAGCATRAATGALPADARVRARVPAAVRLGRDARRSCAHRAIAGVEAVTDDAYARTRRDRASRHALTRPHRGAARAAQGGAARRRFAVARACGAGGAVAGEARVRPRLRSGAWSRRRSARSPPRIPACACPARSTASSSRCARSSASRSRCAARARCSGASRAAFGEPLPHGDGRDDAALSRRPRASPSLPPAELAALGLTAGARAHDRRARRSRRRRRDRARARERRRGDARAARRAAGHRRVDRATTSRCARCAGPTRFSPAISSCCKALGETRPARALRASEAWRPWRAYAVMHLWRNACNESHRPFRSRPDARSARCCSRATARRLPGIVVRRASATRRRIGPAWHPRPDASPVLRRAAAQLAEYFAGDARRRSTCRSRRRARRSSARCGRRSRACPHGETISYRELARRAGRPASIRAAGAATGRNPLSIVVPCHRIVGADGSLTGYAGGLERKRALLALERARRTRSSRAARPDACGGPIVARLVALAAIWGASFIFIRVLAPVLGPVLTAAIARADRGRRADRSIAASIGFDAGPARDTGASTS